MTTGTSNARGEVGLFRKRPVVIEAVQYPCEHPSLKRCDCDPHWPHADGPSPPQSCSECGHVFIETLEGRMRVSHGDWIIRGVQGEFYPCKPDIFAATYEPADAAATPPADARGDVRRLVNYDAGLLNDFGGGDVNWWQDYLRAEIERANEFWREQTEQALAAEGVQAGEVEQRARELLSLNGGESDERDA